MIKNLLYLNSMTDEQRKVHSSVSSIEVTIPLKNILNGTLLSYDLSQDPELYSIAKQYMDTLIEDILVYNPDIVSGIKIVCNHKIMKVFIRNSYPMRVNTKNHFAEFKFKLDGPFSIEHFIESIQNAQFIDENDQYYNRRPFSVLSSSLAKRSEFMEKVSVLDQILDQGGDLINVCKNIKISDNVSFKYLFFDLTLKETSMSYELTLDSPILNISVGQFLISLKKANVFDSSFSTMSLDHSLIDFITAHVKQALLFNNQYDFDLSSKMYDMLKIIEIDRH